MKKHILIWTDDEDMHIERNFDDIKINDLGRLLIMIEVIKKDIIEKFEEFDKSYFVSSDDKDLDEVADAP